MKEINVSFQDISLGSKPGM